MRTEIEENCCTNLGKIEIVESIFYSHIELKTMLPKTMLHIVLLNCYELDGFYMGKSIIKALENVFLTKTNKTHDEQALNPTYPNLQEAAKYLNMDETTLRRKVDCGLIEYIDYAKETGRNRDIRFSWSSLQSFTEKCCVPVLLERMKRK